MWRNYALNQIQIYINYGKLVLQIFICVDFNTTHRYVLLKERNMLLTMEHECNDKMQLFPSPERIDKVEISMENLEMVVRERNKAYHMLETGETGERPTEMISNAFSLPELYQKKEYPIPKHMNKEWLEKDSYKASGKDLKDFLLKYKEKLYLEKRRKKA